MMQTRTPPLSACITALLLVMIANAGFAADDALSRADFLAEVVAVLRVASPERSYTAAGPLEIEVTEDGEETGYIYLNNLYGSVSADPAERLAEVQRFVAAILQPSQETLSDADLGRILPVIRDTLFTEQVTPNQDDELVQLNLAGDLVVLYVLDFPDRIQYLYASDLAALHQGAGDIHALAVDNLSAKSDEIAISAAGSLFLIELDGTYESSTLLLDGFWQGIEDEFGAAPVVAIPTRDVLVFTSSADAQAVDLLQRTAARIVNSGGYPVSAQLYVRDGALWRSL